MAKQRGFLKIEGTLGDVTFLKTQDGYLVKEKTSIPASRIANDPAFQRTRENFAEFGRAGKAGKVLRNAFASQVKNAKDGRMVSRLHKNMMRVLQADKTSTRGQRNVIDGEANLLQGFEFNNHAQLHSTFLAPYSSSIDRATGDISIAIQPFIPNDVVIAPSGATHFKIRIAGGWIDFEKGEFEVKATETAQLPFGEVATAVINQQIQITASSTHPLFLLMGIEFTQELNGAQYPLRNGAYNCMAIVLADGVA